MAITPINRGLTAGIAGQRSADINPNADPLITGDVPQVFATDELVAASQDLAAHSVVGLNASGALVMATRTGSPAVKPIGVLVYATVTTAGETTKRAGVYRGGVFNPDLLVWDATFSTDEQKRLAFEGSPSPTAIVIRKPRTMTV